MGTESVALAPESQFAGIIQGWLAAKFTHSNSTKTQQAYSDTIGKFVAALRQQGRDLDSEHSAVAATAQAFAGFSARGKQVAGATYNQRLAILSSFYEYAIRMEVLHHNPIARLDRAKVQQYAGAQPLSPATTREGLGKIDRTTLAGARDYAILSVLLQTGRRLSEVASLRRRDLRFQGASITLTFHAKGGKVMLDTLPRVTTEALTSWLQTYYGPDLAAMGNDAPLWVSLERGRSKGQALGIQSIADICEKYLGTSKVHTTRHTWAHTMQKAGATPSQIQARLGHESLATTGRYLGALNQAENEHAETIAAMLGIK